MNNLEKIKNLDVLRARLALVMVLNGWEMGDALNHVSCLSIDEVIEDYTKLTGE